MKSPRLNSVFGAATRHFFPQSVLMGSRFDRRQRAPARVGCIAEIRQIRHDLCATFPVTLLPPPSEC